MRTCVLFIRSAYIYNVAKSVGFSFGQNKKQIKTKSFSLARSWKSVGFLRRTNHSPGVGNNYESYQVLNSFSSYFNIF